MRTLLRLTAILTPLSANYVYPFLQLCFLDRISVNLAAKTVAEICTGEWPFAPTDPNALLSA
ncbi:hypothetical protein CP500_011700 [Tychonema bourrellyi FEM_GT703]|uniref:Uncharacterized protein n=1 Tax=Tychonema bourrellyi FEM_GT703 TaxID=2040638 RepID=A0A2G4F0M1_9CYAN|nr:hypothetical protein CP500_011700 [Tychonema bourrellyi FEM_GT703]